MPEVPVMTCGQRVSRGNFDVTQDSDFRPVSQLKIIE